MKLLKWFGSHDSVNTQTKITSVSVQYMASVDYNNVQIRLEAKNVDGLRDDEIIALRDKVRTIVEESAKTLLAISKIVDVTRRGQF